MYEASLGVADGSMCMSDIPEFIVCSNEYLGLTQWSLSGYPAQVLQYRSVPDDGYSPTAPYPVSKTPADINAEIHKTLQNNQATRIYLSRVQLDSYLTWRLSHGGGVNFPYMRVDDESEVYARNVAIGVGATAGIAVCTFAGISILGFRRYLAEAEAEAKKQESKIRASAAKQQKKEKDIIPGIANNAAREADDKKSTVEMTTASASSSVVSVSTSNENDSTDDDTVVNMPDQIQNDE